MTVYHADDANITLGLPIDSRDFSTVSRIWSEFGIRSENVRTNDLHKVTALARYSADDDTAHRSQRTPDTGHRTPDTGHRTTDNGQRTTKANLLGHVYATTVTA